MRILLLIKQLEILKQNNVFHNFSKLKFEFILKFVPKILPILNNL